MLQEAAVTPGNSRPPAPSYTQTGSKRSLTSAPQIVGPGSNGGMQMAGHNLSKSPAAGNVFHPCRHLFRRLHTTSLHQPQQVENAGIQLAILPKISQRVLPTAVCVLASKKLLTVSHESLVVFHHTVGVAPVAGVVTTGAKQLHLPLQPKSHPRKQETAREGRTCIQMHGAWRGEGMWSPPLRRPAHAQRETR